MKNYPTLGKDQLKLDLQQEIITEILYDKVTICFRMQYSM